MATSFRQDPDPEADERITIRTMRVSDLAAVIGIERRSYGYPWSERIFLDCLGAGYYCRVAERDGVVRGYGIMSLGAAEAHILNLCIDPEFRRQGIARHLLSHFMRQARNLGAGAMYLEVRPSNTAAVNLYESFGFNEIHVRPDYYPARNGREDALVLGRNLPYID